MTSSELSCFVADSSQKYLDLLKDNPQLCTAKSYLKSAPMIYDDHVDLLLEKDIPNPDTLSIRLHGKLLNDGSITFRSYDATKHIISLIDEHKLLTNARRDDIGLEADLTYLIQRTKDWSESSPTIALPTGNATPVAPAFLPGCNDSQKNAINMLLHWPLTNIWGGPGCGKTTIVLASGIMSNVNAGRAVLLAAPTNIALDQALAGILDSIGSKIDIGRVIRLGTPTTVISERYSTVCEDPVATRSYYALQNEMLMFDDFENPELQKRLESYASRLTINRIQNAQIVAVTVDGYLARKTSGTQLNTFHPDHVFLDEAAYCPLVKALPLFDGSEYITLLGDYMQLPPVFPFSNYSNSKQSLCLWSQSAMMAGFAFSDTISELSSRRPHLIMSSQPYVGICKLMDSFRYGQKLSTVLNKYAYHSDLNGLAPEGTEIVILDIPNIAFNSQPRTSTYDAEAIDQYLAMHNDTNYAILTPYRNQSKLLKHQLPTAADANRIMTVHSAQSREWDTVFLSVVDTTAAFLTDSTNPLNHGLETIVTAVSRAKKKLVIVCDVNYWSNQDGQLLQGLIHAADTVFPRRLPVYEEVEY